MVPCISDEDPQGISGALGKLKGAIVVEITTDPG